MSQSIEKIVFDFLLEHIDVKKPILIGLSGGPDSICLLHLLCEFQKKTNMEIHIAHVNHGWRLESAKELTALEKLSERLGIPFHKAHFDPTKYSGNKENEARKERYLFFCKIQKQINAQGILLGHHKNDQAETALKQIFEGVSLLFSYGMKQVSQFENLVIFRPLLDVKKKEILDFLKIKGISYFVDETNDDPKFLRGKMRTTILPFLSDHFGKDICDTLSCASKEAQELGDYFSEKLVEKDVRVEISDWGWFSDIHKARLDIVEIKFFLRKTAREFGLTLSHFQIEMAANLLFNNVSNKYVHNSDKKLYIDRGGVFFLHGNPKILKESRMSLQNNLQFGNWKVVVSEKLDQKLQNHWQDVFLGKVHVIVPKGEYYLNDGKSGDLRKFLYGSSIKTKRYSRLLSEMKVPHIFVNAIPVISDAEGHILEDFLCGLRPQNCVPCDELCSIQFQRI